MQGTVLTLPPSNSPIAFLSLNLSFSLCLLLRIFIDMAATTNSFLTLTPPHSTHQLIRRLTLSSPSSFSLFRSTSPSLSLSTSHRSNSLIVNSVTDPNITNKDNDEHTPIEFKYPAYPAVIDINQICEILPHRYPFLLVDRVVEYTPGVSAVGIKNVTTNDYFFAGHFPGRPIMPGVLMIEAMAQVGGVVMLQPEVGGKGDNISFAGIDKVRFRKPVVPGDTLVMRMTILRLQKRFKIGKMEGKAYVDGELVCEAEFLLAYSDPE